MTKKLSDILLRTLKSQSPHLLALAFLNLLLGLGMGVIGLQFLNLKSSVFSLGALSLIIMIAIRGITTLYSDRLGIEIFTQARTWLSKEVFQQIHRSLTRYPKAEILDRLTSDTFNLIDASSSALVMTISHVLLLICVLSFMVFKAPMGIIVIAFGVLLYSLLSFITRSHIQKKTNKMRELETKIFLMEKNFVDGHEFLRTSSYFNKYFDQLIKVFQQWSKNEKSRLRTLNFSDTTSWALRFSFILVLASSLAQRMGLEPMYFYWIFIAIGSLSQLNSSLSHLYQMIPQYKRSQELLKTFEDGVHRNSSNLSIQAENLYIFFDPRKKSKAGVGPLHFHLIPGDYLWLNGSSGSGKTTLLRSLLGSHFAYTGQLSLPNQDFSMTYVEQEPFIFEGEPLWVNLGQDSPTTPPRNLIESLSLEDFFSHLSEGMHTIVGTEKLKPSKGQARRLAILRALMQSPDLLILDEPTAGLDAKTAKKMLGFLKKRCSKGILIVADHRTDLIIESQPTKTLFLNQSKEALHSINFSHDLGY